jgi:hypothetical protein
MIAELKLLLAERSYTSAVIIDDAYDERPLPGDLDQERWNRFFDYISPDDEARLIGGYGKESYDAEDVSQISRNDRFIKLVWNERRNIPAAEVLFSEFDRTQNGKREELAPLVRLLSEGLGLKCLTLGREGGAEAADAPIIFLDLFLGLLEDEDAINRAIQRVKKVIADRPAKPPSIVLLSASPRLSELGPRIRDEGELLGCQFRMVRKKDLDDAETMTENLYELVVSHPDALLLNEFLLAWKKALEKGKDDFVRSIRRLDLSDYANMNALILDAENELVGDYVLDLYDLHLHNVLEGDEPLIRAAKTLNSIKWGEYPPAQFMPSSEFVEMMDGTLFHNQTRTRVEIETDKDKKRARLGDIFLGPAPAPAPVPPAAVPAGDVERETAEAHISPERYAYVVLSQACDLQHGDADRILLLRGKVKNYGLKQHEKPKGRRTPIMQIGKERYTIEWDAMAPETWLVNDIPAKLAGGFRRERRFRLPYALQLQQDFIGRLGRVGTMADLPARYAVGVRIFLKDKTHNVRLLVEAGLDRDEAVCLVGRDEKNNSKEWLLLSENLHVQFRKKLREVPSGELPNAPFLAVRDDPGFYRRLKSGIQFSRERTLKPFKGLYDVVQVLTRPVLQDGVAGERAYPPLTIEIIFG